MKTITRSRIYLPMAAMILTAALAIPAAAQTQVPFKGAFQGNDTVTPPTLTQSITGIGTLVGQFSSTTVLTLTASGGTGSAHWIAANGDSIDTTVVGSPEHVPMSPCQVVGAQPEDSYAKVTEIHTITGGTGRFAGVQGSFTLTLYHDVVPRSDGTHGPPLWYRSELPRGGCPGWKVAKPTRPSIYCRLYAGFLRRKLDNRTAAQ